MSEMEVDSSVDEPLLPPEILVQNPSNDDNQSSVVGQTVLSRVIPRFR